MSGHDADEWRPERWLDVGEEQRRKMENAALAVRFPHHPHPVLYQKDSQWTCWSVLLTMPVFRQFDAGHRAGMGKHPNERPFYVYYNSLTLLTLS